MEASQSIVNPWQDARTVVTERTGSTMDDARVLALAGSPTGTVVVAGFQEKGRGRVPGRSWISASWESLLATVVVRSPGLGFPLRELPLRAGVAVALAVEACAGIPVMIKWPNDLLCGGKKLAGVLCESFGSAALVGIGVNCGQASFPDALGGSACSLLLASGRQVLPFTLLSAVLARLKEVLVDPGWSAELRARLHGRGSEVSVDLLGTGKRVEGILIDVDEECRLVLRAPDGETLRLAQGELRTGP